MKIKFKFVSFLGLIGCIYLSLFTANSAEIDPYPTVTIPIFKGGYNLQKDFDASKETKSIRYHVQIDNPPAEVLEFYDAYFNGSAWQPFFETCQRNWEGLDDGPPRTGAPLVRQLYASWAHQEMNLKAVLWLTYELGNMESQNEVVVKCRLQPKVDKYKLHNHR